MNEPATGEQRLSHDEPDPLDEGGLRAPPGLSGWRKAWWWFDFIILVKLARLRFIGILAVIGVVITQWDMLVAYYDRWTRRAEAAAVGSSDVEWFCPMHPTVVRDNGKDKCPVCFMPLSKRKKGLAAEAALPPGVVNRVQLSPYRVVLAGVGTTEVDYLPLAKQISAVGFIEFNEREQRKVSAWVGGRIDKLYVNETGTSVEAGEVLADLYSPDLYSGMRELVTAAQSGSRQLAASSRERLRLLGISNDQLDELAKTGKANTHLKIRSPIAGHIIEKYVVEGQYVETGMPLYDVADLSTVWIHAQVYEDDFPFLPQHDVQKPLPPDSPDALPVTATSDAFPDEPFHGVLSFIFPHVDQQTRTLTIRCELANPGHKLKPGTTATVTIDVPPRELEMFVHAFADDAERLAKLDEGLLLAVPESAVIDTGARRVVYRQTQPGVFEGVKVALGPRMTGPDGATYFPVLDGLKPGERVVAAGSFLVDAETRLNPAAGSIYFGGSGGSQSGSTVTAVRPSTPEDPDAKVEAALASLSSEDRALAEAQQYCPVLKNNRLGSMGPPVKLDLGGQTVFVCCEGCKEQALDEPQATATEAAKLRGGKTTSGGAATKAPAAKATSTPPLAQKDPDARIKAALAKLSPNDRKLAEAQRFCAVLEGSRLGAMGAPVKLVIGGKAVFVCCEVCKADAQADGQAVLDKVRRLKGQNARTQKK
ncbi:MAG TPA: efflux RND transporter periplasmic adaptor subunit [Pirellulales bacterium]|nr:efflux RND transporter periplasmic adaptor subunit [Pirellulales bacterium]